MSMCDGMWSKCGASGHSPRNASAAPAASATCVSEASLRWMRRWRAPTETAPRTDEGVGRGRRRGRCQAAWVLRCEGKRRQQVRFGARRVRPRPSARRQVCPIVPRRHVHPRVRRQVAHEQVRRLRARRRLHRLGIRVSLDNGRCCVGGVGGVADRESAHQPPARRRVAQAAIASAGREQLCRARGGGSCGGEREWRLEGVVEGGAE
mmetsp:Transcript_37332/g.120600  ORF Transcript_37332/g.120600 Transcript_37332/m.120600 type:complete len:207 (-) Transcript_37332:242-862(-)